MVGYRPPVPIPGHIFCLDEDTEIYFFKDCLKKCKIKNLPKNFYVISYNFKNNKKETQKATKTDTGLQDCFEIILEGGRGGYKKIIATPNHRFFNKNNEEVCVKNLNVHDSLLANFSSEKTKYYKIKSIKNIGKRKTYDISVEKNHNFFLANGILSHNSYGKTGCQPKGNKVLMSNGNWKEIENIKVGDKVISPQEDGSTTFEEVINTTSWFCNEVYDIFNGRKNSGYLYSCSFNHKIPLCSKDSKNFENAEAKPLFSLMEKSNEEVFSFYINPIRIQDIKNSFFNFNRVYMKFKKSNPCMVYGFEITGKSKWYVTNNWMVTHNSGKSFKNTALSEYYYEYGYKIWDVFGGLRKEGPFRAIPSDEKKLWSTFLSKAGVREFKGPKEFKVDLFYPMMKNQLPDKLPKDESRVVPHIFTIDFKSLKMKDISVVTGSGSSNQERILKRIQKELSNVATSEDILQWFEQTENRKKLKRYAIYHSFFEPFCNEQLFEGPRGKYIIDFKEVARNKDRFFVLVEDHIPEETYRYFFINYFIRTLFDLVNEDKIHKRNLIFLRELIYL